MEDLFAPPKEELMRKLVRYNTKAFSLGLQLGRQDIIDATTVNLHTACLIACSLGGEGKFKDSESVWQALKSEADLALSPIYTQEMAAEESTWVKTNIEAIMGGVVLPPLPRKDI